MVILSEKIHNILQKYDPKKIKIGTLGSHSALQILKGAKDEGFQTVLIATSDRINLYKAFPLAAPDIIIEVKHFRDLLKKEIQEKLIKENVIIIPHGSFVEHVGSKNIENELFVPMFGNRKVLDWESSRKKGREWLEKEAGIKMPQEFQPEQINKECVIKFDGAKGGKGFFVVKSHDEYLKRISDSSGNPTIQEFIKGKNYYFSFFYSPIAENNGPGIKAGKGKVELIGIDRRDEIGTTVVGNKNIVFRESLLPGVFDYAKKVVESSIRLFNQGIIGPFCLETVIDENFNIYVFEISARIVAGTNLFSHGSPYTWLSYEDPMSMGRRIAREIKNASAKKRLNEIIY